MRVGSTHPLTPVLVLALLAGCATRERFWPLEITHIAREATVRRDHDTMTIVTNAEGSDGPYSSAYDRGLNAALLRAANETEAAGFTCFDAIEIDPRLLMSHSDRGPEYQYVRYTVTIRPVRPEVCTTSRKRYNTAEVIAGPIGGLF